MTNAGSGKSFISAIVERLGGLGVTSAPPRIWLRNTSKIRKNSMIKITVIITKKGAKP
jgi:hypothetical protein